MVVLNSAKFVNFCNIANETVQLSNQGLVLVTGENGSGKSSLFIDGIYYSLYGESFKYGDNPGDAVVRNLKEKGEESFTEMDLTVDGEPYKIVRSRKSSKYSKGVTLLHKDVDISRGTSAETQKLIDNLLGMSSNTFRHSVVFNPDMLKFPSLTDTQKKKIFDELLQLGCFEDGLKATKDKLKEAASAKKMAEAELNTFTAIVASNQRKLEKAKVDSEIWEKNREATLESIQQLIDAAVAEVAKEGERLSKLKSPGGEDVIKKADERYAKLSSAISDERKNLSALEKKKSSLEVAKSKKLQDVSYSKKEIEKMNRSSEAGICSLCKQPVSGKDHKEEISKVLLEIEAFEKEVKKIESEITEVVGEIKSLSGDIDLAVEKLESIRSSSLAERKKLEEYNAEERSIRYRKSLAEKELESQKALFEREKNSTNHYLNIIASCQRDLDEAVEKEQALIATISRLAKIVEDEQVLEELFGNKGAKLIMVRTALPILNREARRVQNLMGTELSVTFTLRESQESYAGSLQVSVTNPRGASSYEGDSSGERGRVDLIILLSLLSLAASRGRKAFAQVFFDEVFEHLDKAGQAAALSVIKEISLTKSSVFVISHTASELGGQCDKLLEVKEGKVVSV